MLRYGCSLQCTAGSWELLPMKLFNFICINHQKTSNICMSASSFTLLFAITKANKGDGMSTPHCCTDQQASVMMQYSSVLVWSSWCICCNLTSETWKVVGFDLSPAGWSCIILSDSGTTVTSRCESVAGEQSVSETWIKFKRVFKKVYKFFKT